MNLKTRLLLSIGNITLLALIVRIWTATWTGLTTDEANGVMVAVSGSWIDMMQHLREDGNAPLFYAILRDFANLFGHHGFALKCFSIALATLAVPIVYWLFRRMLAKELCLSLAILLALCPTFVRYGTLIRPYALEGVLGLLSTFACLRALSASTNRIRSIAYGVSTALLMYTHYWGAFVPIGHVGLVLVGLYCRWFGKREVMHWFAGAALSLLLFLPQILSVCMVYCGVQSDLSAFDVSPRPCAMACDFLPELILSKGYSGNFMYVLAMFICNFLVLLIFVSPKVMIVTGANSSGPKEIIYDGRMWKAATICGLAAAFWVDFFLPSLRFRYLMPFVPMIFIVFVTGFNALFAGKSAWARIVLPCAIWIVMFVPFLVKLPVEPETTTGAIVGMIADKSDRQKDLVLISWETIAPTINFTLPPDIESISYPHLGRTVINHWPDMTQRLRQPEILVQLFGKLQAVLDRGGKIWLVDAAHTSLPLDYRNNDLIRDAPFVELCARRCDQIRSWLVTHAKKVGRTQLAPGHDFNITLTLFAPVGNDPEAQARLPKPDSLWKSVYEEENSQEQGTEILHPDSQGNSGDRRQRSRD